jgi:hypothetical protein
MVSQSLYQQRYGQMFIQHPPSSGPSTQHPLLSLWVAGLTPEAASVSLLNLQPREADSALHRKVKSNYIP